MSEADKLSFSIANFSGQVRMFPVPEVVLFPSGMQPLHVFEDRYRELLRDALAGDHLIAMPTLVSPEVGPTGLACPTDLAGNARKFHSMACLGKVVAHHQLDNGQSNILLMGLARIHLSNEMPLEHGYRQARAEICRDHRLASPPTDSQLLHRLLLAEFQHVMGELPGGEKPLDQLLSSDVPLGVLTDIVAHTLAFPISFKQQLLAELDVQRRARLLLSHLTGEAPLTFHVAKPSNSGAPSPYPPSFSVN